MLVVAQLAKEPSLSPGPKSTFSSLSVQFLHKYKANGAVKPVDHSNKSVVVICTQHASCALKLSKIFLLNFEFIFSYNICVYFLVKMKYNNKRF